MSSGPQRQRHGVTKHLVAGAGGLLVGAAVVLLLRGWLSRRRAVPAPVAATAHNDTVATPASSSRTQEAMP